MDKETVIKAVLKANNLPEGKRYDDTHVALVKEYCLEHGKSPLKIDLFIQYIAMFGGVSLTLNFSKCFDIAADYYIRKFNLVLVYDKDNKLINLIDRYVRTKRQTDCRNQEAVQELSSCNQED